MTGADVHYKQMMAYIDGFDSKPQANEIFKALATPLNAAEQAYYKFRLMMPGLITGAKPNDWKAAFKQVLCLIRSADRPFLNVENVHLIVDALKGVPQGLSDYIIAMGLDALPLQYRDYSEQSAFEYYLSAYRQTQSPFALQKAIDFYARFLAPMTYMQEISNPVDRTCMKFFVLAADKARMSPDDYLTFLRTFVRRNTDLSIRVLSERAKNMIKHIYEVNKNSEYFIGFEKKARQVIAAEQLKRLCFDDTLIFSSNEQQYGGVRHLGEGTYAHVFEASIGTLRVAVKQLKNESEALLLLEEARILGACQHPHIVRFLGVAHDGKTMRMSLAPKGNVMAALRADKLPEKRKLPIASGISAGMSYLHQQGIVWRDVKLENVVLDENYQPQLADFGAAVYLKDLPKEPVDANTYTLYVRPLEAFAAENKQAAHERFQNYLSNTSNGNAPKNIPSEAEYGVGLHSDVYSYAIMLWHLFAHEKMYPFFHATRTLPVATQFLLYENGALLDFFVRENGGLNPELMQSPEPVKAMFRIASSHNPVERPSMEDICSQLTTLKLSQSK